MSTVNLSLLFNEATLNASADPGVGLLLFTYAAGSSTKTNTYTTSSGTVAQTNPIVLNARGEPPSPIWLIDGTSYKFVLAPSTDTDPPASAIRTIDNVVGINDVASSSVSEWVASSATPTYISATSFSLVGDHGFPRWPADQVYRHRRHGLRDHRRQCFYFADDRDRGQRFGRARFRSLGCVLRRHRGGQHLAAD